MNKKKYGVVLIGCGHMGRQHIQDIYFRENIKMIGVVDVNPERAREFQERYNSESWSTGYRRYLKREDVDIVIITTYVDTHLEILKECLANKKHVLCEKPIGRTLEEGGEFADAVRASSCKVLVSHVLRHNKTYQRTAELIKQGTIGELTLIRMVQNHHCKDWNRYRKLMESCPPIVDCGVHYMDVMQWFTGVPIVSAGGFGGRIDNDLPDGTYNYGVINVRLKNGCIGYYEAGWSKNLSSGNMKEFIGLKGRISIVLNANRFKDVEEGDLIEVYLNDTNEYIAINCQAEYKNMWGQLEKLIDMIENDSPAVPTIDEVFSALKVVLYADKEIRRNLLPDANTGEVLTL